MALMSAPNRSSPGQDRISYADFKAHLAQCIEVLTSVYNCNIPSDWKQATIKLILKASPDSADLSEWRPISLLLTTYKIFMKILERRLVPWIVRTGRLLPCQKGSLPRNGLQEHVFGLNMAITGFRHQSSKMFVKFLDLADAFGSIDHLLMLESLNVYGYPENLIEKLTKDIIHEFLFSG